MAFTFNGVAQIIVFFLLVVLITKPVGLYLTVVFSGGRTWLDPALRPVERGIYRLCGVDPEREQNWIGFTVAMLLLNLAGVLLVYLLQRVQQGLPLNPAGEGPVAPDLAWNTAVSFASNTNWQNYGGETTMSYLSQMAGLAVQNFLSAATGIVLAVALVRALTRRTTTRLGNFWVDITRCVLYVLLPLSFALALVLVWQGVPQTFGPYIHVISLQGFHQLIALGPVASQEAIKELGTNGGGFFNANSAHPFENPTALTNLLEMLAIIAIPAGLIYMFGKMAGNTRHGWALFAAVAFIFLVGAFVALGAEQFGNPIIAHLGVTQAPQATTLPGSSGNMEGKEVRFGIADSALFAAVTTAVACGAVNSMHDSFTPLGGMVPLVFIGLGETVFGGVGAGLYGLLIFAVLAVFIAGLMVGRTPEFLGKKIEQKEMKMAALAILILPLSILGFTAIASVTTAGTSSILNTGPHGFTEMLYAFTSTTGNNGSAFAGLSSNTPFYNWALGLAMLIGRYAFIVPMMALAGSIARKKVVPASAGTFPTTGPLFAGLMVGVIIIVGALTFFPAYALGPIVEQLLMHAGKLF